MNLYRRCARLFFDKIASAIASVRPALWQVLARRERAAAGWGAWTFPLLGQSALQLIENQFTMLLECAEALFQSIEH